MSAMDAAQIGMQLANRAITYAHQALQFPPPVPPTRRIERQVVVLDRDGRPIFQCECAEIELIETNGNTTTFRIRSL